MTPRALMTPCGLQTEVIILFIFCTCAIIIKRLVRHYEKARKPYSPAQEILMFFNRILPKPAWLPEVIKRTTPEELVYLQSHPSLQSSIAEFASVEEVLALLPRAQASAAAAKAAPVPHLISGSELTHTPTEWVWPARIARGKLTLIGGAPGSGKTTLAMELISCVTMGMDWPCQEGVAP